VGYRKEGDEVLKKSLSVNFSARPKTVTANQTGKPHDGSKSLHAATSLLSFTPNLWNSDMSTVT
jgi:hypothetical protein